VSDMGGEYLSNPPPPVPPQANRIARQPKRMLWPVRTVAGVVLINGIVIAAGAFSRRDFDPMRMASELLPLGVSHWGRALSVVLGFLLVYLSFFLFRRRRLAWMAAVVVCALATLLHLLASPDRTAAIAPIAVLAILVLLRRSFSVRIPTRSLAWGATAFGASLLFAVAYGTLGFWLLDRSAFGINFHMGDALIRTLRVYGLVGDPELVPRTREARWFLDSLAALGAVAMPAAVYALFRPAAYRLRTLPHERERARSILKEHGRSSDDFFKLLPDKSYFFIEGDGAFVAYKVAWGMALALGDPSGPENRIGEAVEGFTAFCERNGWDPVFVHTLPDFQALYAQLGFNSVKIGEEAVVDLARFAEHTSREKGFRQVQNRFEKKGFQAERHLPPHPGERLDRLAEVSREWLSLPGRRERTFALGQFDRAYLGGTPVFTVSAPDGRLVAFANEIPGYREGEATIDLMRHRREIPNGAMDYLFLRLMLTLHTEGYRAFSLGLAPLAGVGEGPDAKPEERALRELFAHLNRFFSFRGLRSYKTKFDPQWRESFIIYRGGPLELVRLGIALVRATEGSRAGSR
jgi:phosphatidylglycerol lysyltransferase